MAKDRCDTFGQVLRNCDDQVTVRILLMEHVPVDVQDIIRCKFNDIYNRRRINRETK